jgi:hypothetical protein
MINFKNFIFTFMDILHINKQQNKLHYKQTYCKNKKNSKKKVS